MYNGPGDFGWPTEEKRNPIVMILSRLVVGLGLLIAMGWLFFACVTTG